MKILSIIPALPAAVLFLFSCSGTGEGKMDNPFGEGGKAAIEASYTSNADTVFLSWKVAGNVDFDSYSVTSPSGTFTLPAEATECTVTHVPYNRRVNISVSMISGGQPVKTTDVPVTIDGIDTWIASRIIPDSGSVTEGDGMYSIYLGDGRSMFLMGDSYTGTVSGGKRVSGNHMYRNTYSIYNHSTNGSYALCDMNGSNTSAAVPEGVTDEGSRWYWPGHGFVVGDNLYVFQFLMYRGEGAEGWNFVYDRTDILQYSLPDIGIHPERIASAPVSGKAPVEASPQTPIIHYGAAALNDIESTGYLYIYAQTDIENGLSPVTEVYVARTKENTLYSAWEFWNGTSWVSDEKAASALQGLDSVPVSSQFNVFRLGDKYVLLAQNKAWNSGEIYTFTSSSPNGPWGNRKLIYKIPDLQNKNWYTYNAMAHPQFEKDGMILISFNVNTNEFSEQISNVESYRPRFFWVEKDDILK